MYVTDPIADMLTRIRNALTAKHTVVDIPRSRTKIAVAEILKNEGYVTNVELVGKADYTGVIRITLKYGPKGEKVINGLKRVSRPGLRVYAGADELPKVLGGLGVAIISTNKGIMTDKAARSANLGGEVMAYVW
ncbi:MAG: 30S ribosomal protein S8 [Clostridia bacterium]|nr:30S ribosomal protein S8 [Clostridia bacterium]